MLSAVGASEGTGVSHGRETDTANELSAKGDILLLLQYIFSSIFSVTFSPTIL